MMSLRGPLDLLAQSTQNLGLLLGHKSTKQKIRTKTNNTRPFIGPLDLLARTEFLTFQLFSSAGGVASSLAQMAMHQWLGSLQRGQFLLFFVSSREKLRRLLSYNNYILFFYLMRKIKERGHKNGNSQQR